MNGWESDKAWADHFMPEIKAILGVHLLGPPPVEDDELRATDLIVLEMAAVRIGVRVRRPMSNRRYYDQFTIRSDRPNGHETELAKIISGWGNFFFYGVAKPDDNCLDCWVLGHLNVFRQWFNRQLVGLDRGKWPGEPGRNPDGSSTFLAFNITDLPPEFVVARLPFSPKRTSEDLQF